MTDQIEKEMVYRCLKPQKGLKLLDIGCGTGQYSLDLAGKGLDVTGVDISTAMLDKAREKATAARLAVDFTEADAMDLPFRGETFDLVLSVVAFEFVPDLSEAIHEANRVLKTGGRLVIGLIARNSAWGDFYIRKARRSPSSVFNQARFYTLDELLAIMPGKEVYGKTALFIPPDFDFEKKDEVMAYEDKAKRAGRTDGGFICALAVK